MNDKMKAKCYRLDYNELGLSTLCVEKDKEIERLKEEYMILQNASDEVEEEKDKEIERLTAESTKWESKFYDEAKKVDRAIEYIETHQLNFKKGTTTFGSERLSMEERQLIDILRGVDKE